MRRIRTLISLLPLIAEKRYAEAEQEINSAIEKTASIAAQSQHINEKGNTIFRDIDYQQASIVIINFTLQFLAPETRQQLLQRIYKRMLPNGCLILSEKLHDDNHIKQQQLTQWHHAFKRANHYSDLEIAQKRAAIENVLIPDTFATHQQRLENCGFHHIQQWFQCFNFSSLIAIKPVM
jgi:tRNA (cmo5U34)-methyltransferase